MENKIKLLYAKTFSSAPLPVTGEEIDFIIKNDCECSNCGKSIFEMYDAPNVNIEEGELLCEECGEEKYQTICPRCENYVMNEEINNDYFVINQEGAKETGEMAGFHKALKHPYYRNDFFGFDGMIEGTFKFIKSFDKKHGEDGDCQSCGNICQECVEKYDLIKLTTSEI